MHWFVRAALHSIFLWSHVDHIWMPMMMTINIFFPALWHMIVSVIYRQSYCQMDRIMSMFRSVNWLIWTMDFAGTTKHVLFLEPWLGLFHLRKHCQPGSLQWRVPREEATKVTCFILNSMLVYMVPGILVSLVHIFLATGIQQHCYLSFGNNGYGFNPLSVPPLYRTLYTTAST